MVHSVLDFDIYRLVEDYFRTCDFIVLLYDQDMTSSLVVEDLEFGSIGYFSPFLESQVTLCFVCIVFHIQETQE